MEYHIVLQAFIPKNSIILGEILINIETEFLEANTKETILASIISAPEAFNENYLAVKAIKLFKDHYPRVAFRAITRDIK